MKVVSDSSPLITLALLGCFDLLPKLYGKIYISGEVYKEVVVDGAALPGAAQVAQAKWIEVVPVKDIVALTAAFSKFALGAGEISAVFVSQRNSG